MKIKKYIKLIFFCMLINVGSYAQTNNELLKQFNSSVSKTVSMVTDMVMKSDPKPVLTMLKISVNGLGVINSFELSDSADSLFKKNFTAQITALDRVSLETYIKRIKLKQTTIMQPISVTVFKKTELPVNKYSSYLKFNKKNFEGKTIILKPAEIAIEDEK